MDKQLLASPVVEEGTPELKREPEPLVRPQVKQATWGVVLVGLAVLYFSWRIVNGSSSTRG